MIMCTPAATSNFYTGVRSIFSGLNGCNISNMVVNIQPQQQPLCEEFEEFEDFDHIVYK